MKPQADEITTLDQQCCRICDNTSGNRSYQAREMMFGWREVFVYFECSQCGCLQIADIPADLARFYPETYPFLRQPAPTDKIRRLIRHHRWRHLTGGTSLPGRMLTWWLGDLSAAQWFRRLAVTQDQAILDLGCGSGLLLHELSDYGFSDLTGADKFISCDLIYPNGIRVYQCEPDDLDGQYDLVMMHHSLEHIPDQRQVFRNLARLLRPQRYALIRVPLADSWAWREYKINWVQMDAPRHLYLHTRRSLRLLAEEAGLELREVVYDSGPLQFWGSEQYRQDIPLLDERSRWEKPLPAGELRQLTCQAERLNQQQMGDQACFYLYKP